MNAEETMKIITKQWCNLTDLMKLLGCGRNKALDIKKQINKQPTFDKNEIHNLNQYLYDNSITLSKSQKTLFVAAILITCHS